MKAGRIGEISKATFLEEYVLLSWALMDSTCKALMIAGR
jgi:hypothetical protein